MEKKNSKKQMCESKARENTEDDGVNYEDEFNKSKERVIKLKKRYEIARKECDRLSRESACVEKINEELVDKLKDEIFRDIINEDPENTEAEEIRKAVDCHFFNIRSKDVCKSEEEVESEVKTESEDEIEE